MSNPLGRIGGLTKAVTILVGIAGAVSLVSGLLTLGAADAAQDFLAGEKSRTDFESAVAPLTATQLIGVVASLAAGVVTIVWMFRIATNLRTLGRRTFWHPLWAIFGWFVPPGFLYVIPFLMLRELWRTSDAGDGSSPRSGESPLLWAWFVLFGIVPAVLTVIQVGSVMSLGVGGGGAEDLAEQLDQNPPLAVAASIVTAAAAVAWILFARRLRERHVALTGER
jgi:hypothetical protein